MTQDTCIRSITNRVNVFANYKASLLSNKSLFISKIQSSRINVINTERCFSRRGKMQSIMYCKEERKVERESEYFDIF